MNKNLLNIIDYLKTKYNLYNGFFCVYGSYATDSQTNKSDVDLLYIHITSESKLCRYSELYNKINISFYQLSLKDLIDDSNGLYGGFFCGKLFNPHIIIENTDKNLKIVQKYIACFFSKLLNKKFYFLNRAYTSDEILKNSINLYIDLYNEYFAYIMRLVNLENFENIWKKWKKQHISLLMNEKVIKKIGNKYYYTDLCEENEYIMKRTDYISRFWIYGAVSHNSDIKFYDFYKIKNQRYIKNNEKAKINTEKFLNYNYFFIKECENNGIS